MRISIGAGVDAGIAMYYFDAPPMMEGPSNALMYWGPLGRARLQFRTLAPQRFGDLGVVVGIGTAFSSAHYMSTETGGTGTRIEPSFEVGISMRL